MHRTNARRSYPDGRASSGRMRLSLCDLDLYVLGFGVLAFRHVHCKNAFFELGFHLAGVGVIRQRETSHKGPVGALDAVIFSLLLLLFELAFTGNGEDAIFNGDFYLLLFYVRQLCLDDVFLVVLGNVRERRPIGDGELFAFAAAGWRATKETGEAILHIFHFGEWLPAGECVHNDDFLSCGFGGGLLLRLCSHAPCAKHSRSYREDLLSQVRTSFVGCLGNLSFPFRSTSLPFREAQRALRLRNQSVA